LEITTHSDNYHKKDDLELETSISKLYENYPVFMPFFSPFQVVVDKVSSREVLPSFFSSKKIYCFYTKQNTFPNRRGIQQSSLLIQVCSLSSFFQAKKGVRGEGKKRLEKGGALQFQCRVRVIEAGGRIIKIL
jgi:hypothetical protein